MSYIYKYDKFAQTASNDASQTSIKISANDIGLGGAPQKVDSATIGNLLGVVYFIAGIVAVLIIILGGVRYATANSDSGQIKSAKDMITYAVVGLVVIIMASAITQFVITNITKG